MCFRMMSLMMTVRSVLTMSKPNLSNVGIKRDDYKAIKRMDRIQLTEYLSRVYRRGFNAGQESALNAKTSKPMSEEGVEKQ